MKNNVLGFGLSAILHVAVVAQLWTPANKPIEEPKEKVVPLNMAMFQEPVKKVEPVIEPPPKVIEKPVPKVAPLPPPVRVIKKAEETQPVIKEQIPLPIPQKAAPKVIKKEVQKKQLAKKKSVVKPKKKVLKKVIKKKPEKRIIKKKVLAKSSLEKDIEKLLNLNKPVVKKAVKTQPRKQPRPPVRQVVKRVAPVHQARRQNQVVRKVPPRAQPPKVNHARKIVKSAPRAKPVAPIKRPAPQRQQAAPNTARFEAAYKSRLRQLIESNKKYPRRAKRRGEQGVVKVSFVMSANGQISQIRVIQSSGSRILDEAAKKTVLKVSGRIPFPKEINKSQWKLTVPLTYRFRR